MSCNIIKMYIFVAPFKVMNYSLIRQLFFNNKNVLEEINNSLLDIKMVKFCNHSLLIFQISLILINKCISLIYNISYIVEHGAVCTHIKLC